MTSQLSVTPWSLDVSIRLIHRGGGEHGVSTDVMLSIARTENYNTCQELIPLGPRQEVDASRKLSGALH